MHPQFIYWLKQQKYFMGSSLTWKVHNISPKNAWDNINWSWDEVLITIFKNR